MKSIAIGSAGAESAANGLNTVTSPVDAVIRTLKDDSIPGMRPDFTNSGPYPDRLFISRGYTWGAGDTSPISREAHRRMNKPTLDSIASAKAKLAEELRNLEEQETQLRQQASADAFAEVMSLLGQYGSQFTTKQKAEIVAAASVGEQTKPSRAKKGAATKEVAPKYWLPHSGETWTGRGRPPRAFAAYEGSAAYKDWKAKHPDERFPKFPG